MNLPVTDNGVRPAGPPDKCCYCKVAVGQQHKPDCVCLRKTVRVQFTCDMVIIVPQHYTKEDVEFWANDSSRCLSAEVEQIYNETKAIQNTCFLCHRARLAYVQEATPKDHEELIPEPMRETIESG